MKDLDGQTVTRGLTASERAGMNKPVHSNTGQRTQIHHPYKIPNFQFGVF